ncbi:MAG: hypothetical protein IT480_10695 [Gammaproteobacteria bacterium]|nr:hypothetical protein [Gammaproteobacteria bacterium]
MSDPIGQLTPEGWVIGEAPALPVEAGTIPVTALVSGFVSTTTDSSIAVIPGQGSGVVTYLTDFSITNSSGTDTLVDIRSDSTGKWRVLVPAKSGITHSFTSPLAGLENGAWVVAPAGAVSTIYASFSGFKL